jgi:hypothetical protein
MIRGVRKKSKALSAIMIKAEKDLWSAWESAKVFSHNVLRGTARENPLGKFLAARLPGAYGICSGEAVDCFDNHTTQLDLIVYDRIRNCPLAEDPFLMPAESLLAVIEVKSTLSIEELRKSFAAAKSIRRLRPYKKGHFVPSRNEDAKHEYRCLYTVFAYSSDLVPSTWLPNEWSRIQSVAREMRLDLDLIDRIVVLDRGVITPGSGAGKQVPEGQAGILHEWFLHLTNFLNRENVLSRDGKGRDPVDWQLYAERRSSGWKKL